MAIGYEQAKNLMYQLDWKMVAKTSDSGVEHIELYHPKQKNRYTVRIDSGVKLLRKCRVVKRINSHTAILCYNHDGSNEDLI